MTIACSVVAARRIIAMMGFPYGIPLRREIDLLPWEAEKGNIMNRFYCVARFVHSAFVGVVARSSMKSSLTMVLREVFGSPMSYLVFVLTTSRIFRIETQ